MYRFRPYRISKVEARGNQRRRSVCPKARSGHRIVADNANIYSFGGYDRHVEMDEEGWMGFKNEVFKELWKFNIASQTWEILKTRGTMPQEVISPTAVLLDNYMLVFGGTGFPFGMKNSNSVHVCNLKTLEWTPVTTNGQPPLQQYGQATTLHQRELYVVGGTTGFEYSMSVHRLNLETEEWCELSTSSGQIDPRYRLEVAIDDKKLFVFGGGTATESYGFSEVPVFNTENKVWDTVITTDHPTARRCHGCVQIGSDVYICGGLDGDAIHSDLWRINLQTLQWDKIDCVLPKPVYFHAATLSPAGQMFIFGGVTNFQQHTRTNELYSVWLKVPTLKEICWQAVMHYIPHLEGLEPQQLLEAGVPTAFVDRVDFVNSDAPSGESPPNQ